MNDLRTPAEFAHLAPLGDRVLILPLEPERMSRGGIELAGRRIGDGRDFAQVVRGRVVAVGPGIPSEDGSCLVPVPLAPGDEVLYNHDIGTEYQAPDGTELKAVIAREVLAKVVA